MKNNSQELKAMRASLETNDRLGEDLKKVLAKHGHSGLRVRSLSVESDSNDCGGLPKVPRKQRLPSGETVTIWVCP